MKVTVEQYVNAAGLNRFEKWFDKLNEPAAAKVTTALRRLELGHKSGLKPLGAGIAEYRIDFGPGYRIYLGQDGDRLIILVGGGTKQGQAADIAAAKAEWAEYKRRKNEAAAPRSG